MKPVTLQQFQSPISGVNDWNHYQRRKLKRAFHGFSLLLAELMIGTKVEDISYVTTIKFQSPISGVNDWNKIKSKQSP